MDFVDKTWWAQNGLTIFLVTFCLIQWIALQALMIHYHFFRKSLKKPTPDGVRMSLIEKSIAFQGEQLEKIFGKLAHFNREIDHLHVNQTTAARTNAENNIGHTSSIETSVASLGELNLKKRIHEIQNSPKTVQ